MCTIDAAMILIAAGLNVSEVFLIGLKATLCSARLDANPMLFTSIESDVDDFGVNFFSLFCCVTTSAIWLMNFATNDAGSRGL